MPLQATSGAASYDAFGGGVPVEPNYIESVFQTWLYTGNGSTQTITNGIDLAGKGGLVWIKNRNLAGEYHYLWDTVRGNTKSLSTNLTDAQANYTGISSFNSNGFTEAIGYSSASNLASWTFRKQPKFFDVVTYTGNGSARTISHNLGSAPACIIVKNTSSAAIWLVYHRSTGSDYYSVLNTTAAAVQDTAVWNNTAPTSTEFSLGNNWLETNQSGETYVAYLFAHNAGGFGLTGTDNVISCGSYTGNGSATGPVITLNYEPQWLMIKKSSSTGNWQMLDNLRGMPVGSADAALRANLSSAEASVEYVSPTSTGFQITSTNTEVNTNAATYIYIAIRRGPMKVPTSGTSVFSIDTAGSTGTGVEPLYRSSFTPDLAWEKGINASVSWYFTPRLLSGTRLSSDSTAAEATSASRTFDYQNGWQNGTTTNSDYYSWMFRRAPSVMDVVCYTGDGVSSRVISHNLSAQPEFIAIKRRNGTGDWTCVSKLASGDYVRGAGSSDSPGAGTPIFGFNSIGVASQTLDLTGYITSTGFRPSVLSQYSATNTNVSGSTYVAYLFATCAGVSKVGSYTGTGADQVINCGFTGGARFVLIKCTNDTFGWYVYDSARGITSSNDPYLFLNSTAAQVTSTNAVDTDSTGFKVTSTAPNGINYSGYNYIFLAIA